MKQTAFEKSIDPASQKMLEKAENEGIETAWDRYEKQLPQCSFGQLGGICCRNCNMGGPCRIDLLGGKGGLRKGYAALRQTLLLPESLKNDCCRSSSTFGPCQGRSVDF